MTTFDWNTAIAECCTHLAGLGNLPPPIAHDPAIQAVAVISLIADTPIQHALTPDKTFPVLTIPRYSGRHNLVDNLLTELTLAAAEPACGNFHKAFSITDWLSNNGFDEIILRSVQHTPDDSGRAALLANTARRARELMEEQNRLRDLHILQLLERDLPELNAQCDWHSFEPQLLAWLLAHEFDGNKTRAIRLQRRVQALRLYAGIADTLCEPAVMESIDAGHKLVPVLMKQLSLTRAQLRALREATPPETFANYQRHKFKTIVLHLIGNTASVLVRFVGAFYRCAPPG
jgi:hypothetical protein